MRGRLQLQGLIALLALTFATAAVGCEKSVRWNDDPPFSMRRADGEVVGLSIDMVRETLRRMGCKVRLVEMPWARALTELEAGRLDILPGTVRTPERERIARFSQAGPQSRNVLFVVAGAKHKPIASLDDLRGTGFRLGAQIGVSYGHDYERLMHDPVFVQSVQKISTRKNLWLMMDAGRLDGVLANEATGRTEIAQLGLQDKIRSSGLVLTRTPASVAFSRASVPEEFVAQYNRVNEVMLKDGSHAAILRRYGSP